MRLLDLDPRWFGWTHEGVGAYVGFTFLCPHCMKQRLAVTFRNPISVGGFDVSKMHWPNVGFQWYRTGETFEDLTVSPSVNANDPTEWKNHWHGNIVRGEIR